ncbi:hypothetical protein [Caudoviricetes sp.]|nr:hypothetical protein [Caudoviricetes sp.]UOF79147.1 hypothetical protein [Caudoviricetes sp.]
MSALSLTKNYEDLTVLFEADLDGMWSELEAKVNGNIDSDNVASGWANLAQLTISDDVTLYFGATSTAYIKYDGTNNVFIFGNTSQGEHTRFYVNGTEVGYIDGTSHDLVIKKDVYFANRSTSFSLFRMVGAYRKPVLVYNSSTQIVVENNTETAHQTLIVFPSGPVAVTENVGGADKYRMLKTGSTANGYDSGHTGAADSGLRTGLSLSANTWYFVYAARVRYGDDAGNNFIMVLDDTEPTQANESTLNTRYGSGEWVYLGSVRRGYGDYSSTTLIPFQMDKSGWTYFISNASGSGVGGAGIQVYSSTSFNTSSYTSLYTIGAGTGAYTIPSIFDALQLQFVIDDNTDSSYLLSSRLVDDLGVLWYGPTIYSDDSRKDGYSPRVVNVVGVTFQAKREGVSEDAEIYLTVAAFQDHKV